MFFLGAGFMLLETKGVVHMALLFGATWAVNSIVFGAILVMILVANCSCPGREPTGQWPFYLGLLVALLANVLVPLETYLALPGMARVVVSCAVVFSPVLFAGIVFAMAFRDRDRPDLALGANIAGVVLGGLSENLSLALGFNHLLWVAVGFYVALGGVAAGIDGGSRPRVGSTAQADSMPPCANRARTEGDRHVFVLQSRRSAPVPRDRRGGAGPLGEVQSVVRGRLQGGGTLGEREGTDRPGRRPLRSSVPIASTPTQEAAWNRGRTWSR